MVEKKEKKVEKLRNSEKIKRELNNKKRKKTKYT